jgi:predicted MPP superfamily phosphohydrolase
MASSGRVEELLPPVSRAISRRKLLIGAGVAAALPIAITGWGYDPDWLTVVHRQIQVPNLDRPLKAVQVSDLHFDRAGSCSPALRQRVRAEIDRLAPDCIFATGDYITRPGDDIAAAAWWVAGLPAREGIYAVLGNHDSPEVKRALADRGVTVLSNTWKKLHGMALAGVGDLSRWPHEPQEVVASIPREMGAILLAHQPDTFWMYDHHVTLQISGHTHGGQVTAVGMIPAPQVLPHLKRLLLHVPELEPLARKHFLETRHHAWSGDFSRDDGSMLYVNRGLGRFKRISVYCPPELTVWELRPYDTT